MEGHCHTIIQTNTVLYNPLPPTVTLTGYVLSFLFIKPMYLYTVLSDPSCPSCTCTPYSPSPPPPARHVPVHCTLRPLLPVMYLYLVLSAPSCPSCTCTPYSPPPPARPTVSQLYFSYMVLQKEIKLLYS